MAGSAFELDMREIKRNLQALPAKVDRGVFAAIEFQRAPTQAYMRSTAKWADQTSNARNGLITATEHVPMKSHTLILAHSVPYGIWLEVRWSGALAIVTPSIKPAGVAVMGNLVGLFGRL